MFWFSCGRRGIGTWLWTLGLGTPIGPKVPTCVSAPRGQEAKCPSTQNLAVYFALKPQRSIIFLEDFALKPQGSTIFLEDFVLKPQGFIIPRGFRAEALASTIFLKDFALKP